MPTSAPAASIGTRLKQARQGRRLSISEAAWRTRIRPDILRALEREQFTVLGHAGFVRRHLASYARFLDLDPEEIVAEYRKRFEPDDPSQLQQLDRRIREARKPPRARWLVGAVASGLLLVVAAVIGVIGEEPAPPQTAAAEAGPRITQAPSASRLGSAKVLVRLIATDSTEATVTVDGAKEFDDVLRPGETVVFAGRSRVDVAVTDGAAVRLVVNGVNLGEPGQQGAPYHASFGPDGPVG